jgi:hypothetical protein
LSICDIGHHYCKETGMNLFMFYLGGNAGKSNIEVHDIQFVAAVQPEDAWPALRKAWFGDANKVHIDGYARINWVDGYQIRLSEQPAEKQPNLYFVNIGAYQDDSLAELHAFDLFVADSPLAAKKQALKRLLIGKNQQHKDNLKEIDDFLLLDKIGKYYIHLDPCSEGERFKPEWQGYQPI